MTTQGNFEKEAKYMDFYGRLRLKINNWAQSGKLLRTRGNWTDRLLQYLLLLPDLVHLKIKLLMDKEFPPRLKGYILIAFGYLLMPLDFIPDFIPVIGFIDDLLVVTVFLNKIINCRDEAVTERIKVHWLGEEDVFAKVKEMMIIINELAAKIPRGIHNFIKKP
jgi:uncharacterized membrane protein YkvA (DUF1232 family)